MTKVAMYQGDCLEVMRGMRAQSVDLIITSPPYEDARTYGIGFSLREEAWVRWAADRFMECLRVSRGIVAWVLEGKTERYEWSATPILLMAEIRRRGAVLRKPMVYARVGIPGSGGPDYFRNDHEYVIVATARRGKLRWSDNTACGHPPKWGPGGEMSHRLGNGARVNQWGKTGGPRGMGNKDKHGNVERAVRPSHVTVRLGTGQNLKGSIASPLWRMARGKSPTGEQNPDRTVPAPKIANPGNVIQEGSDIIRVNVGGGVMGDRFAHENEAPFSEVIAERFVRSFCPPGGIVLDPFGGSGTVAKVAAMHGRNVVLIDVRGGKGGLDTARRRIEAFNETNPDKAARIVWPASKGASA